MTWDNTYMSVLVISMEPIIDLYSLFVEEKNLFIKTNILKKCRQTNHCHLQSFSAKVSKKRQHIARELANARYFKVVHSLKLTVRP